MNIYLRHIITFCCTFMLYNTMSAQTAYIDSLKNELLLHTEEDSIRVLLLNDLIYDLHPTDLAAAEVLIKESEYLIEKLDFTLGEAQLYYYKNFIENMKSNYPASIENSLKAAELYASIGHKRGESYAYINAGIGYSNLGDLTKTIEYYEKSAAINEEINDLRGQAAVLDNIGTIYANQGNYDEAVINYTKSKKIQESLKDTTGIAFVYNNIGTIYAEKTDYPRALENFNKSLSLYEKVSYKTANPIEKTNVLGNIAFIYVVQKKYDKALNYYQLALKISEDQNNKKKIAEYSRGIGNIYKEQKKYNDALEIFKKTLEINREINVPLDLAGSLNDIANVHLLMKEDSIALNFYTQALQINKEINSPTGKCWSYLGLAKTYIYKKEYKQALEYALQGEEIAKDFEFVDAQRDAKELLAIILEQLGDYKGAFESHEQFKILNDSLFNKENIEKMAQLEYGFKYKQEIDAAKSREKILTKTIENTSLDLEKSQRNSLIAIIGILIISLISGGVIFLLKLKQVQADNKTIRIQQKLLRSQMTPHFIFNSLSILQGMILNKDKDKSISYLSQFSKLLRLTLENSRHKTVTLKDELAAINSYMALQNLDADAPYNFTLNIDPKIKVENYNIPPMLIQPFVENAIEHAFTREIPIKNIDLHLTLKDDKLHCTIMDNGVGINTAIKNSNNNKNSLATTITTERIEMLAKEFNIPASVKVEDRSKFKEQGTLVSLIIPYISNNQEH